MAEIRTRNERSLGELFAELSRQASTLIRQEVRLARTEMSQKASSVGRDVAYLAIGGLVVYAGFLALLAALIIGLAEFMAGWLAALIVAVVVIVAGYFVVQWAIDKLKRVELTPERTVETLREDKEWLQEQIK